MAGSTRGSYAKTVEVRRGIVAACIDAFGESGFHGASMAEIARKAGVSHTGLLHHFPRKENLLAAVLSLQDERAAEYLAAHQSIETMDAVDVLHGMISALTDRSRPQGMLELAAVLGGEAVAGSHPAHAHFAERNAAIRRFLARVYMDLANADRLRGSLSPDVLALSTLALLEGLQNQWLFDPQLDVDAAATLTLSAFVPELKI